MFRSPKTQRPFPASAKSSFSDSSAYAKSLPMQTFSSNMTNNEIKKRVQFFLVFACGMGVKRNRSSPKVGKREESPRSLHLLGKRGRKRDSHQSIVCAADRILKTYSWTVRTFRKPCTLLTKVLPALQRSHRIVLISPLLNAKKRERSFRGIQTL